MASINIKRDVKDAFYRYKMPKLQAKIEGKGNGIKTLVSNMTDVAKALHRPPTYVTKYFGAELGALTNCDEKAARYIVNGAHEAEKLQSVLDGFISKFVLCPQCENPETILSIRRDEIYRSCKACGHKAPCDNAHKICAYIRTNPPPKPVKIKQAKDNKAEEYVEGMVGPTEGFEVTEATGLMRSDPNNGPDEDDWDETGAEAIRQEELSGLSDLVKRSLAIGEVKDDPLDAFGDWLGSNESLSNDQILDQIQNCGLRPDKAIAVLVQVLFVKDFCKAIQARQAILTQLLPADPKAQAAVLGSIDRMVLAGQIPLGRIPVILQALYNLDVLGDGVLEEWRERPSKRFVPKGEDGMAVRNAAKPFFAWLEQSESDEEDEGED